MRSPSTVALCLAALTAASAVADKLPYKKLNCKYYPEQHKTVKKIPDWATLNLDLTGIPIMPLNLHTDEGICEQDPFNSECEGFRETDRTSCENPEHWALTYEEGPSKYTPRLLEALDKAGGIKATFFVVASNLCYYASQLIDAVNAGHEIGIMGWSHDLRLSSISNDQIIAEIKWAEKAVMELTGIKPRFFRPPYGNMDDRVRFILDKLGYIPVLWTADTEDWRHIYAGTGSIKESMDEIKGHLTMEIDRFDKSKGPISVEHDMGDVPTKLAGDVIKYVRESGWMKKFVPMTVCLNEKSHAQTIPATASTSVNAQGNGMFIIRPGGITATASTPVKAQGNGKSSAPNSGNSFSKSLREVMVATTIAGLFGLACAM